MRNKICVLIVKGDKVFITKENNEWIFPTFVALKEDKLFSDIDEKLLHILKN